jgi:hypothetical protein
MPRRPAARGTKFRWARETRPASAAVLWRNPFSVPAELDQLVADCLAANPDERPRSAEAIIARLDILDLDEPWDQEAARRWWTVNAKRLGTMGHEVAVSAARTVQPT